MFKLRKIMDAIESEIGAATLKFPTWPTDPIHAAAIVGEECGELTQAALQHTYEPEKATRDDVRTEALQTAAMAIRFLMSMDDYEFSMGPEHKQDACGDVSF